MVMKQALNIEASIFYNCFFKYQQYVLQQERRQFQQIAVIQFDKFNFWKYSTLLISLFTAQKKSFPLRISSVNVTKSAVIRNLMFYAVFDAFVNAVFKKELVLNVLLSSFFIDILKRSDNQLYDKCFMAISRVSQVKVNQFKKSWHRCWKDFFQG